MKIFMDTANVAEIKELADLGIIYGVTTNPSLIAKTGRTQAEVIPEIAKLDARWIHAPSEAPAEVMETAGGTLDHSYPLPLVDHTQARLEALNAYAHIKRASSAAVR